MPRLKPLAHRLLVLAAVLALALGAVACGDSDDDGGDSSKAPATTSDQASTTDTTDGADGADGGQAAGGTDPERVKAAVAGMYKDFADADAAGVCAAMTEAVRDQIAQQVLGGSTEPKANRTCEESFDKFLTAAARAGILERLVGTTVDGVQVKGDTATATITVGGRSGKIQLVKENGDWRFGEPPRAP